MANNDSRGSNSQNGRPAELIDAVNSYLTSKAKGRDQDSGMYRRNAERELKKFIGYIDDRGCDALDEIDALTLRDYIRDKLLGQGHSPRTVQKYYGYVSAWVGWAQREGLVDTEAVPGLVHGHRPTRRHVRVALGDALLRAGRQNRLHHLPRCERRGLSVNSRSIHYTVEGE